MLGEEDQLGELLKEIPEPTEEMVKSEHTMLTLDLIQSSRDATGLWADPFIGAVCVSKVTIFYFCTWFLWF